MSFLKRRSTRLYVGMFLILTMALWGLPTAALADSGTGTVSIMAGSLTETGDFSQAKTSVTLNGANFLTTFTLNTLVTDATGSGAGWHLTISGTPLSDGVNGHPTLSQAMLNFGIACLSTSTCTAPIASSSVVGISTAPVVFFSVAPNSGMGSFQMVNSVDVFIPANAFAGTYTSTLTLAVVSGP